MIRPAEVRAAPTTAELGVDELGVDVEVARLVERAQAGDREAFGTLYERFARMVHAILLTRVPRPAVDDLVQDVFLVAMRRLTSLREPAAFGGWIATIARNRAVDHFRRTPETTELPEDLAAPPSASFPGGPGGAGHAEARAVLGIIQSLPEAYRETLVMRLVEGMSGPEIAAKTGLTPASVRVNLHRGMKQLREKLNADVRHA